MIKRPAALFAAICLAFPLAALAGPDANQQAITKRIQEAKMKLQAAEAAQGAERQRLMDEHMKMMQDTMGKMQAMAPRKGMSLSEHEDWMSEHQKLMQQMMDQMMNEHHLLMQTKCKP